MPKHKVIIIEVDLKPSRCINCGGKIVPVLYGEPDQKGSLLIATGKRIMGGCIISDNDPQWGCIDCYTRYIKLKKKHS